MKILATIGVLAAVLYAQGATVTGCLKDATGQPDNTKLTFTPATSSNLLQNDTNIVTIKPISVTPSSGCFTQYMVAGNYWLTSETLGVPSWFVVPTNSGTVEWTSCLTNVVTFVPTTNANTYITYNITTNTGDVYYPTQIVATVTYVTNNTTVYTNAEAQPLSLDIKTNTFAFETTYTLTNKAFVGFTLSMYRALSGNTCDVRVGITNANTNYSIAVQPPASTASYMRAPVSFLALSNTTFQIHTNRSGGATISVWSNSCYTIYLLP